jgi:hypothetical protein
LERRLTVTLMMTGDCSCRRHGTPAGGGRPRAGAPAADASFAIRTTLPFYTDMDDQLDDTIRKLT